jgi:RNA polymerase sigma-70 factor (ECF subfamily)
MGAATVGQVAVKAARSEQPDALLEAARRGDADAFLRLLAPARPRLESLAYRLLDDQADIADVLQDVYLSAYRALPGYRGDARLATWLYRITYNACLRHQARRPDAAAFAAGEERPAPDHAGAVAVRLDLAAALADLPIEQRALVLMVDRDGFDYSAAAEALSIPLGTVSSRLASARAKLRRALSPGAEGGEA